MDFRLAIIIFLSTISFYSVAQTWNSNVDRGDWSQASSWDRGTVPDFGGFDGHTVNIQQGDTIVAPGSIAAGWGEEVNINGVLLVFGDYTQSSSFSAVTVGNTGTFIVTGNLNIEDNADFVNNGSTVVLGDLNYDLNVLGQLNDENGNTYVAGTTSGNTDWDGNISFTEEEVSDLEANDPDLLDFVNEETGSTLPIELVAFDAEVGNTGLTLYWQTASEVNFSHFEVQISTNGENFTLLGEVEGKGGKTLTDYQYTVPIHSGSYYFRLKAIDIDGSYELSKSIFVEKQASSTLGSKKAELKIYPSILSSGETFKWSWTGSPDILNMCIYDLEGRQVYLFSSVKETMEMPKHLKANTYLVTLQGGNQAAYSRVIVK